MAAAKRTVSGYLLSMKGTHFSPKVPKGVIYYQSSYEQKAFEVLDGDASVVSYERAHIAIPYEVDGELHHYVPDILVTYIDETKKIIEVKPKSMVDRIENQRKAVAGILYAADHGMAYKIWTEADLGIVKGRRIQ